MEDASAVEQNGWHEDEATKTFDFQKQKNGEDAGEQPLHAPGLTENEAVLGRELAQTKAVCTASIDQYLLTFAGFLVSAEQP